MTDEETRFLIYDITMREGMPPANARLGADAVASMKRLAASRMLVLGPDTDEILMAGPFSAVPTPFRVTVDAFSCYGNCIWDALGIAATLQKDAQIDTSCADCGAAAHISVQNGQVIGDGFMHFALPPRVWWQDIVFT
jgi:hypothetical protein